MNIVIAQAVINELPNDFDSHEFIQKFLTMYEKEYIELLHSYISAKDGRIFRAAHAKIGDYLLQNSKQLNIEDTVRVKSMNIKGNNTENQKWAKV